MRDHDDYVGHGNLGTRTAVSLFDGDLVKDSSSSSSPLSEKSFSLLNNLFSPSKSFQLRLVEHGPDLNARKTLISIELLKIKIFFQISVSTKEVKNIFLRLVGWVGAYLIFVIFLHE